jgi:hypothetical protein
MPKVNVYLPEKLARAVGDLEVPLSSTCQAALEHEVERALIRMVPLNRFTVRLRQILEQAWQAAEGSGRNWVGVEDVMLAILDEGQSLPAVVIEQLGQTEAIRAGVYNQKNSGGSNRVGLTVGGEVYGWVVETADGLAMVRPDGTRIHLTTDDAGAKVFRDDSGEPVPPIPLSEAHTLVELDDDGNVVVIIDAAGRHTGRARRDRA